MRAQRVVVGLSLAVGLTLVGLLAAAEPFRSGLQPGERLPGAFKPLNVTGPRAGEEHCLVCEHGLNPVVMVFARESSEPLARLFAKLDAAVAANQAAGLGGFAVFLSDKERLKTDLPEVAKKQALKHLVLSIDAPAGPEDFKVAKDADVTVVLYREHLVKANHAFKKGELTDKAIDAILADLPKVLAKK